VSISRVSPLVVIFLTVFIDLLGFGIVLPLLPRYAAFLQAEEIPPAGASFDGTQLSSATDEFYVPASSPDADRMRRRPKLSYAQNFVIGMLMASFSAMQFLFAPLWGRLSDRIGRRPVLLL